MCSVRAHLTAACLRVLACVAVKSTRSQRLCEELLCARRHWDTVSLLRSASNQNPAFAYHLLCVIGNPDVPIGYQSQDWLLNEAAKELKSRVKSLRVKSQESDHALLQYRRGMDGRDMTEAQSQSQTDEEFDSDMDILFGKDGACRLCRAFSVSVSVCPVFVSVFRQNGFVSGFVLAPWP